MDDLSCTSRQLVPFNWYFIHVRTKCVLCLNKRFVDYIQNTHDKAPLASNSEIVIGKVSKGNVESHAPFRILNRTENEK